MTLDEFKASLKERLRRAQRMREESKTSEDWERWDGVFQTLRADCEMLGMGYRVEEILSEPADTEEE